MYTAHEPWPHSELDVSQAPTTPQAEKFLAQCREHFTEREDRQNFIAGLTQKSGSVKLMDRGTMGKAQDILEGGDASEIDAYVVAGEAFQQT